MNLEADPLHHRAKAGILCKTGIREHDIEFALLPLDLCEQAIQIAGILWGGQSWPQAAF